MKQVLETIQIEEEESKPLTSALQVLERMRKGSINLETKKIIKEQQKWGIFTKPSQILRWAHVSGIRKQSKFLTDGNNGFCARGIMQQYLSPDSDNPGIYQLDAQMIARQSTYSVFEVIHNMVTLNNTKGSTFLDVANYLESKGL